MSGVDEQASNVNQESTKRQRKRPQYRLLNDGDDADSWLDNEDYSYTFEKETK